MEQIKKWYRSVPIWLAVFLYAAAALVAASWLSNRVTGAAYSGMTGLTVNYILRGPGPEGEVRVEDGMTYYSYSGEASASGVGTIITSPESGGVTSWVATIDRMSEADARRYELLRQLTRYAPFAIYSALLLSAALAFYFTKLKKPLTLLENASAKIAESELDFSLDYAGRDEMARLCAAFEKMRSALDENNRRMLSVLDERRQLNDAYTHDLRTPIAVLKGYTDLLSKYLPTGQMPPEEVMDTVRTMSAHVARLEQFVGSMNTAQKLADVTVRREDVPAGEFAAALRETAIILAGDTGLSVEVEADGCPDTLRIDPAAATQVFENLLGNALRFARSEIAVRLEGEGDVLALRVADDGPGFSKKELLAAAKPYYSGAQDGETYHFGLGLHICRTLCEKHGGGLALANGEKGGAEVTARFAM